MEKEVNKNKKRRKVNLSNRNTPIPQVEIKPSEELNKLIQGFKPRKFYKTPTFYISLFALLVSFVAICISYISSPISNFTKSNIEYVFSSYAVTDNSSSMAAIITNNSDNPTDILFVSIFTASEQPAHIVVQSNFQYTIERNSMSSAIIKFDFFPPRAICSIIVDASVHNLSAFPSDLLPPFISSVYSRDGFGKRLTNWKP